jgi:hypothetical protein
MKYELHYTDNCYPFWESDHELQYKRIILCGRILSKFGLDKSKRYILTVRVHNPRQKGYTQVELTKRTSGSFWTWGIPSMGLVSLPHAANYFELSDSIINDIFPNTLAATIWIKFDEITPQTKGES